MMQAAENGSRVDRAGRGTSGGPGRLEKQAPVRTFRVVVPNELGEDRPQMLLVDDNQVVEALVPQSPDDPLAHRIGVGRLHWTEQSLDTQVLGPPDESPTVDAVPVAQ